MSIAVPLYGFGTGGGSGKSSIIATAPAGSTVTCSNGTTTKTAVEKNGVWTFKGCDIGTWTVTATLGSDMGKETVTIAEEGRLFNYYVTIAYRMTPAFTYTGDYAVVDDSDTEITDFANYKGNWKIRFLTSGDLTFTNLYGWDGKLDVFLVGGGGTGGHGGNNSDGSYYSGSGGGSGYTKTVKSITVQIGTPYKIVVGAGNGKTTALGNTANAGTNGTGSNSGTGGNGGSGGGTGGFGGGGKGSAGGTDGNNGAGSYGGKGQGTTTREFGEKSGALYASGGVGASGYTDGSSDTSPNTGNGGPGGGFGNAGKAGASGIVIIRNARKAA